MDDDIERAVDPKMSLWFVLKVNNTAIGSCQITRQQYLDLSDKEIIADEISNYAVSINSLDGHSHAFYIKHRYGDGGWALVHKALGDYLQLVDGDLSELP